MTDVWKHVCCIVDDIILDVLVKIWFVVGDIGWRCMIVVSKLL